MTSIASCAGLVSTKKSRMRAHVMRFTHMTTRAGKRYGNFLKTVPSHVPSRNVSGYRRQGSSIPPIKGENTVPILQLIDSILKPTTITTISNLGDKCLENTQVPAQNTTGNAPDYRLGVSGSCTEYQHAKATPRVPKI